MNRKSLLLIISAGMSKRKTIFSKNNFVDFAASILMITDRYLIIFVHLLTIMKIVLYTTSPRLLDNKLIMKFINFFFIIFQAQAKNSALYKIYDEKLWCVNKYCMFEHTSSSASRRQIKSIFSELNSKCFEFGSGMTMNYYDAF